MDLQGKALVAYGTSRTKGDFASSPSLRWVNLLSSESNGTVINFGVNGATLLNDFVKENVVQYNSDIHGYIILEYGTNDARAGTFGSTFGDKLSEDLDYIINVKGWPADYIIVQNYYYPQGGTFTADEYNNQAFIPVVSEFDVNFADYLTHFRNYPNIASLFVEDGIHENDLGNRAVADFYKSLDLPSLSPIDIPTVKIPRKMVING